MPDKVKLLYETVSKDYDVGTYEQFSSKLQDEGKRKAFYDGVGAEYDLGDYATFSGKVKKKILSTTGSSVSGVGSGAFQSKADTITPVVTQRPAKYVKPATKPKNITEAVDDDNNYLSAMYNQVVGAGTDFIGGLARMTAKMQGNPIMTGLADYYGNSAEHITENLRLKSSSKQYEEAIQGGFDVSQGVLTAGNAKALPLMIARFAGDMGVAIPTAGASYLVQNYNQGLKEFDKAVGDRTTKDPNELNGTRELFAVAYSAISSAADKLSLGFMTKSNPVAKKVKQAILRETIQELAKGTGKITTDVIEQTASRIAKKSLSKFKSVGMKGLASGGVEGLTEGVTGFATDVTKLITNRLEDKNIFDHKEITENFWKNRLNEVAGGAVLGGLTGAVLRGTKSTDDMVAERVSAATSNENLYDIAEELKQELADRYNDGSLDKDRWNEMADGVQKYIKATEAIPFDIGAKKRKLAIQAIVERDAVAETIKQKTEQAAKSDEALVDQTQEEVDLLEAKKQSLNDDILEAIVDEKYTYSVDPEKGTYFKKLGEDGQPHEISEQQYRLEKQVAPKVEEAPVVEQTETETPEQTFEQAEEIPSQEVNLDSTPQEEILLDEGNVTAEPTNIDTSIETDQGTGAVSEIENNSDVSEIGSEVVNPVLQKAETDLAALKQVENKTAKYEASVKRLTEAKNAGQISEQEYNDTLNRFDDVMADAMPAKNGKVQEISAEDAGLEIVGEVNKPSSEKLAEIKARRTAAYKRLAEKGAQANSGFNPDVIADLVEIGSTYIEEGVVRFSDFAERLQKEYGKEIPTSVIKEVYQGSAEANGLGVRKFPESVQESDLSQDVKEETLNASTPYTKQDLHDLEDKVDAMSEVDRMAEVAKLTAMTEGKEGDLNIGVLAGISLMEQYSREGKAEEAGKIADMLSQSATIIAQTLRQFGQLRKTSAASFIAFVEKHLGEKGKKLTDVQRKKISELFEKQKQLFQELEVAQEAYVENLDPASRKKYYEALEAFDNATRDIEGYLEQLLPRDLWDTLSSILKGNLLTFKSLLANPLYNLFFMPVRFGRGEISNAVDFVISNVAKTPRSKASSVSPTAARIAGRSFLSGLKTAAKNSMRGNSGGDLAKYDVGKGLKPAEAWKRLLSPGEGRDFTEKLSDFFEGTIGVSANLAFRGLPFGDFPFSEMAKNQRLYEIAKTKGLTREDIERFMIKPDEDSLKDARSYGDSATFQDNNALSTAAKQTLKAIEESASKVHPDFGGAVKLTMNALFPFIKTPASVALKIVRYATPLVPTIQTMFLTNETIKATKAFKSNPSDLNKERLIKKQRLLSESVADVAIASALTAVAKIIVANGLLTGSAPEEPERRKERDFLYATQPPFTINISGFKRLLAGDDPTYKAGDTAITYNVLGIMGAVMGIVNDTQGNDLREEAKKAKKVGLGGKPYFPKEQSGFALLQELLSEGASTLPSSIKYLTEQSFLQGVESVMGAISKGNYDQLGTQLYRTMLNLPVPNTFTQVNKSWRENMKDPYTDNQWETFANIADERFGDAEGLPERLNIWGEPVPQTPSGSSPLLYQAVDPFKTQSILTDPVTIKVFDIQRKSQSTDAIPPSVPRYITIRGERRDLTKAQYQQFAQFVGQERKKAVAVILKDYNGKGSDKLEYQIERLKNAYEYGSKIGKGKFLEKNKDLLK